MDVFLIFLAIFGLFLFFDWLGIVTTKIRYRNHKHISAEDLQDWLERPWHTTERQYMEPSYSDITYVDDCERKVVYKKVTNLGTLREVIEIHFPKRFWVKIKLVSGKIVLTRRQFEEPVSHPTFKKNDEIFIFQFISQLREFTEYIEQN